MKILIDRYYGNKYVTKSYIRFVSDDGEIFFDGEAREAGYADYGEKFPGCMSYCIARGNDFRIDIACTIYSPMTFKLVKIPGRLSCCFIFDEMNEEPYKHINIGYADRNKEPEKRKLHDVSLAKETVTRIAYEAFVRGDKITCDVSNKMIQCDMDN